MLDYFEQKPVYAAGPGEANQEWLTVLKEAAGILSSMIATLTSNRSAVQALCSLARIDFAAVEDELPSVLASLAVESITDSSSYTSEAFVKIALDYYGRTRQLPHFLTMLEKAITSAITSTSTRASTSSMVAESVSPVFTGPLLSLSTRAAISRECSVSLGVTQVVPLLESLLELARTQLDKALDASSSSTSDESSTPAKKKRKTAAISTGLASPSSSSSSSCLIPSGQTSSNGELASLRYQAIVQLVLAVANAQSQSQTGTGQGIVEGAKDGLVASVNAIRQAGLRSLDMAASFQSSSSVAEQRCAAVTIQLLVGMQELLVETESLLPIEGIARLLRRVQQDGSTVLPLLRLEGIRVLLETGASASEMTSLALDSALSTLVSKESKTGTVIRWGGYVHDLREEQLGLVVWYLLTRQYLSLLE